jgi:hypothetical protein
MLASLGITLAIIFAISPFVYAFSMLLLGVSAVLLIVSYAIFPHLAFEQLRTDVVYESALAQTFFSAFNSLRWIASVVFWGWSIYLGVLSIVSWTPQTVQLPLISWFLAYCLYPASYLERDYGDSWFGIQMRPHHMLDLVFRLFVSPITLPLRALLVLREWLG